MSERGSLLVARLTRRREGRWVAGVCNGLAAALGVPVRALRAVVALRAVGNLPAVALLYAVAWVFLPPEGEEDAADRGGPGNVVDTLAVLAVVAGAVLLLGQFTAWLPSSIVVPALLATAG